MLQQRDGQPWQHEARRSCERAQQQQQVDWYVEAAQREGAQREVGGVAADVVQQLEDGQSEKKIKTNKLTEGNMIAHKCTTHMMLVCKMVRTHSYVVLCATALVFDKYSSELRHIMKGIINRVTFKLTPTVSGDKECDSCNFSCNISSVRKRKRATIDFSCCTYNGARIGTCTLIWKMVK